MAMWSVDNPARPATSRDRQKARRRQELLSAAAELFAERGFAAVRLDDLGAAVGISGPALYRHFPNKDAVLVELLVGISSHLLAGGRDVVRERTRGGSAVGELVDFHLDFAVESPALIRIQDRDLASLPDSARRDVRRMQREYVEVWVTTLCEENRDLTEGDARTMAHAVFGLMNSTPHSTSRTAGSRSRHVLRDMALRALGVDPVRTSR
ncbi:SACE_7040 family transcriptional regulator [Williamsia sp. M5A3_1d]